MPKSFVANVRLVARITGLQKKMSKDIGEIFLGLFFWVIIFTLIHSCSSSDDTGESRESAYERDQEYDTGLGGRGITRGDY